MCWNSDSIDVEQSFFPLCTLIDHARARFGGKVSVEEELERGKTPAQKVRNLYEVVVDEKAIKPPRVNLTKKKTFIERLLRKSGAFYKNR